MSRPERIDVTQRLSLKVFAFEREVERLKTMIQEIRALLSVCLSVNDVLKKKGLITDEEVKEEIKKYITKIDPTNNERLYTENDESTNRDAISSGHGDGEPVIPHTEGDRES